ncbi:MAG TPA: HD domain-containing protein, partial [Thermoleophilaceae bacterium]
MPKLPRGAGKATTKERAKKPAAKRAATKTTATSKTAATTKPGAANKTAAAAKTAAPAKKANGAGAGKPATTRRKTTTRSNGSAAKPRARTTAQPRTDERDFRHRPVDLHEGHAPAGPKTKLTDDQRRLLGDLFAVVEEHSGEAAEEIDRDLVERAFVFSCDRHADQRRASGEDFITHPLGVAKICAGMRLDTATLCAALLHDT